jgi:hypothetical protein
MVEEVRRQAAEGLLLGFSDKDKFPCLPGPPRPPVGVTWQVFVRGAAESDLEKLSEAETSTLL